MDLGELFTKYESDKNTHHSYGPFYEELLTPIRPRIHSLLEVGIAWGGSLKAWRDWLPGTRILGIDNHADPGPIDGVDQLKCDSTDATRMDHELAGRTFDVIVDDGCHWETEQIQTFNNLWPRLNPGGLYIIEDIQNVDASRETFEKLGGEVVDRRHVKGRQDDVLVVFRKPEK